MADIPLSGKSTTTTIIGGYIYIAIPDAGSPTGFTGYRISETAFKADLQALITTLQGDVTTLQGEVTTLQDITNVERFSSKTDNFSWAQPANSAIIEIWFFVNSGTPTVSVGTAENPTAGFEDIMTDRAITGTKRVARTLDEWVAAGRSVWFNITGGDVDITIYYRSSVKN